MYFIVEVDNGQLALVDALGNVVTSSDLGSGKRGLDVKALLDPTSSITIHDGETESNKAKINANGYLYVTTMPPATPSGKTAVRRSARGSVSGSSSSDDIFVIPNGSTLELLYFEGGFQGATYDSCVTLYYAPDGTVNANAVILAHGYCAASNFQKILNVSYAGNGTRAIIARRQRLDGTAKEGYIMWQGWY